MVEMYRQEAQLAVKDKALLRNFWRDQYEQLSRPEARAEP